MGMESSPQCGCVFLHIYLGFLGLRLMIIFNIFLINFVDLKKCLKIQKTSVAVLYNVRWHSFFVSVQQAFKNPNLCSLLSWKTSKYSRFRTRTERDGEIDAWFGSGISQRCLKKWMKTSGCPKCWTSQRHTPTEHFIAPVHLLIHTVSLSANQVAAV